MQKTDKLYIQSVNRALSLIECIAGADHRRGLLLTDIARQTNIPISTAYRILHNLVVWEYLEELEDGHYRLGSALVRLGMEAYRELDVRRVARPELRALADKCGQTIYLATLDEPAMQVQYVAKIRAGGIIQLTADVGTHNHIHSTANGKVLVSDMADAEIVALLHAAGMPAQTDKTITTPDEFLAQVRQVRERGYALDLEENEGKVVCVAAPIRDGSGRIVASVSISGVKDVTLQGSDLARFSELVQEAAARITKEMS